MHCPVTWVFTPLTVFFSIEIHGQWRLRQLRTRLVAQQQPVSFRSWRSRRLISGNGSWHGIHLPHGRMAFPVATSLRAPCHKWQSGGGANGGNGKSMSKDTSVTYCSSLKVIYCIGAITLHDFIMTLLNMGAPGQSSIMMLAHHLQYQHHRLSSASCTFGTDSQPAGNAWLFGAPQASK